MCYVVVVAAAFRFSVCVLFVCRFLFLSRVLFSRIDFVMLNFVFLLFFFIFVSLYEIVCVVCCILLFFWDLYTARFSFGFVLFTFWSTQGVYEVEHYTNKSRKQFNMLLERYWIYVEAQCVIVLHQKDRVEWRSVVATKIVSARESGKQPYASIGIEQWKYIRIP